MSHHSGKKVVLVGAGPAGLTTGLLLAKRGWNVVVGFENMQSPLLHMPDLVLRNSSCYFLYMCISLFEYLAFASYRRGD